MGLAITRSLVELHGGAIRAESAGPGRGSTFVIDCLSWAIHLERNVEPQEALAAPSLRVLVVDDNVDAAQGLAELLNLQGHVVEKAHDAASALQAVEAFQPSIVLLDIALPDQDGYEVASQLRARPELKEVRLIALTASARVSTGRDRGRPASTAT